MSTLILSRRLPPRQLRHWPHQPVGNCNVAPSSLVVQQHSHNAPRTWPHAALAIALAIGLHAALAAWLMADHPQAPEPTPPMPITVQWVPPPVAPPVAQPTPPEPAPEPPAPAPAPRPEPAPTPAPPEPKPAELPKPKAQPRTALSKPVAKPAAPAPSIAAPTPTPAAASAQRPAPAASQTTTAPIGRAGYLNNPPPVYPPAAARRHQEGTTMLRVHVLPNGRTDQVQVLQSSGVPALDDAAQAAVRQWTFIPAKRGDTPVEGWVNVPMAFKLAP
ncbi:energy transducer TonB [Pseudomonas syringae]|uniref:energy transducer TonB n=1 Tax=Pseudomonas syringae TaxID=317 RepID=UPI00200A7A1F|nr:energy transducer TonB [Pseudomonas syringae]MCK9740651.1 TonB family protein [Pseudomonas syringae pv. syringae]MCK9768415.1 TonB family protein [Pseudomonas syringae pv. syringae]